VILAIPPFMSPKGVIKPHNRFSVQSKRSEVLFVDYIAEHLTPNGRAAVVVPEGIIFQSQSAYKQLREMLVKHYLVAVISLPAGVFNPYSGVKTSILLLDKPLAKKSNDILFLKIDNDGFNLGAQRRPIDRNDLPAAVKSVRTFRQAIEAGAPETFDAERYRNALVVSRERIGENGEWNLSGDRYAEATVNVSVFDFVPLGQAASRAKQGITPSKNSGSVNYIGLENIESGTGGLVGEVVTDFSEIKSTKTVFQVNNVLYGKLRPNLNKVHLATFDGICSTDIFAYQPHDYCIPEYLAYVMRSPQFNGEVLKGLSGAQLPRVNAEFIENIQIPVPPLEVQKAIVAEIEGYQKIIDGARQVVENYQPRIPIHPDWPMVELGEVAENLDSQRVPITKGDRKEGPYPNGTYLSFLGWPFFRTSS
jgi:type I restriction enzyme M protein